MPLTPDQRAFLEERHFAVLGTTNASGAPHLTIMWYLLDGDDVVFNTKAGRTKQSNLQRDPNTYRLNGFVPTMGDVSPGKRGLSLGESARNQR